MNPHKNLKIIYKYVKLILTVTINLKTFSHNDS